MARGVDGRIIFIDDADRIAFLAGVKRLCRDLHADILAYCLMGNHFHFAIQVGEVGLSSIMQRLLSSYARTFNRRHGRTGHLFQARHEAIICADEKYLACLIQYIHMNPVRAGLVSRPQDWPWSSISDRPIAQKDMIDLHDFDPWPKETPARRAVLIKRDLGKQRGLSAIGADISLKTGIPINELTSGSRRRAVIVAKRLITQDALICGHSLITVARWLNVTPSSMTRYTKENTANTGKPDTHLS